LEAHLCCIEEVYKLQNTFIQEFIPFDGTNKTVSFTAFSVEGDIKAHWIGEKVREHPYRFGTATFARSIECKELIVLGQRLLNELKYTGVCEIEFLLDPRDKKYKLIELNARTWLWVGLAKICGVNYALLIYNYLNGIEPVYSSQYQTEVVWVNFMTDIPFAMAAILKRRLGIKEYFLSFNGRITNAIFSWKDIFPGIMSLILSIYIAMKRR
jgi:predicted ATP-grasp superfamily ATP-dependent carboligase